MTADQALSLQTAIRRQTNARRRLEAAGPADVIDAATEYISATEECCTIASEIVNEGGIGDLIDQIHKP